MVTCLIFGSQVGFVVCCIVSILLHFTSIGAFGVVREAARIDKRKAQGLNGLFQDFLSNDHQRSAVGGRNGMVSSIGTMCAEWMKEYDAEPAQEEKEKILNLLHNVLDLLSRENREESLAQALQLIEASEFSDDRKALFVTSVTNYASVTF